MIRTLPTVIALLILFAISTVAQVTPSGQNTEKVDVTKVGGSAVGASIPVNCVSGCAGSGGGGAVTVADGADVNSGTTTDAAVSGDANGTLAGKIRNLNKILTLSWDNVNNRINVFVANASLAVTQSGTWNITNISGTVSLPTGAAKDLTLTDGTQRVGGTVAVTGTFWQATQPVSGTFWQATQPVSIASMPSTPVTGTFWQATQPVSGPLTDAQLRASAVPVSGSFFQATQPISAASLPLPTGASTEATLALVKAKTDNLDVALSTRTKPADQQHAIIDNGAVTISSNLPANQNGLIPVFIMSMPPVLPASALNNPLLYRSALRNFCYQNLCPLVPTIR